MSPACTPSYVSQAAVDPVITMEMEVTVEILLLLLMEQRIYVRMVVWVAQTATHIVTPQVEVMILLFQVSVDTEVVQVVSSHLVAMIMAVEEEAVQLGTQGMEGMEPPVLRNTQVGDRALYPLLDASLGPEEVAAVPLPVGIMVEEEEVEL
jgi:hypothetical protein